MPMSRRTADRRQRCCCVSTTARAPRSASAGQFFESVNRADRSHLRGTALGVSPSGVPSFEITASRAHGHVQAVALGSSTSGWHHCSARDRAGSAHGDGDGGLAPRGSAIGHRQLAQHDAGRGLRPERTPSQSANIVPRHAAAPQAHPNAVRSSASSTARL